MKENKMQTHNGFKMTNSYKAGGAQRGKGSKFQFFHKLLLLRRDGICCLSLRQRHNV